MTRALASRASEKKITTRPSLAGLSKENYDTGSGPAGGRLGRPGLKELRYTALEEFQKKYDTGLRPPWILQK